MQGSLAALHCHDDYFFSNDAMQGSALFIHAALCVDLWKNNRYSASLIGFCISVTTVSWWPDWHQVFKRFFFVEGNKYLFVLEYNFFAKPILKQEEFIYFWSANRDSNEKYYVPPPNPHRVLSKQYETILKQYDSLPQKYYYFLSSICGDVIFLWKEAYTARMW